MTVEAVDEHSLLDVEQLARRLGVPRSWIYNQAQAGKIPALKLGKYVKFSPTEIEEWLSRNRHGRK